MCPRPRNIFGKLVSVIAVLGAGAFLLSCSPPNYPTKPIELKYYGFANRPGEPRSIFLAHDGDVFIAREGDIVNRRYKIVRVTPNAVEILDVLSNNRQSIPLTQG